MRAPPALYTEGLTFDELRSRVRAMMDGDEVLTDQLVQSAERIAELCEAIAYKWASYDDAR